MSATTNDEQHPRLVRNDVRHPYEYTRSKPRSSSSEISAQRPPPSLSTGLGNLAYRGTSELKIRNVTVYPAKA